MTVVPAGSPVTILTMYATAPETEYSGEFLQGMADLGLDDGGVIHLGERLIGHEPAVLVRDADDRMQDHPELAV